MNEELTQLVQSANVNPSLEFRDGQCLFKGATPGGTVVEKLVSWAAVREAATNIPVDSGWLPPEVVRWGMVASVGEWAVAFIPRRRRAVELTRGVPGQNEEVDKVEVPLPGMVIFGVTNKYFVWAVKGERLDPFAEVYRAPLPNVMQDASVCWGLIKPPAASAKTIVKAYELFITSTFNNHAASGKSKSDREDVREVLRGLAAAGEGARYPADDLVRQVGRTGVSLDACVREFFKTGEMPG